MIIQAPYYQIVWNNMDFNLDLSTISNYHEFMRPSIDALFKNAYFRQNHQKMNHWLCVLAHLFRLFQISPGG